MTKEQMEFWTFMGAVKQFNEKHSRLPVDSSLKDMILKDDVIAFGEIGLAGEIRGVSHCEQRIKEASRLGFSRCIIPKSNLKNLSASIKKDIEIIGVKTIREAFEAIIL